MTKEPFSLDRLKPVELQDKSIFKHYLAIQNRRSCECNFGNIYAWAKAYQLKWLMVEGRLLVYSAVERVLHMPLGNYFSPQELFAIYNFFREKNLVVGGIYDVPENYLAVFPEIGEYFRVEDSLDNYDYVYSVARMYRLDGRRLRKKRNLIKQFRHQYPGFKCRPITVSELPITLELARRLQNGQSQRFDTEEESALVRAFKHFDELEMEGLMLWASDTEPVGFAVFSQTTSDTYDVHFEKTDHEYKGASQTLTQQVACHLRGRCRYLNREQDLGNSGLRQAKRSLDPAFMERRSLLTPRNN